MAVLNSRTELGGVIGDTLAGVGEVLGAVWADGRYRWDSAPAASQTAQDVLIAANTAADLVSETATDTEQTDQDTDRTAIRSEFAAADAAHVAAADPHSQYRLKVEDTYENMLNTPASFTGDALKIPQVNAAEDALVHAVLNALLVAYEGDITNLPGSPTTVRAAIEELAAKPGTFFTQTDTEANATGRAEWLLRYNAAENAVESVDPATIIPQQPLKLQDNWDPATNTPDLTLPANQVPDPTTQAAYIATADHVLDPNGTAIAGLAGDWYWWTGTDWAHIPRFNIAALTDLQMADRTETLSGSSSPKQIHDQIDTVGYIGEWDADSGAVPSSAVLRKGNWFAVADPTGWNIVDGQFFAHGDVLVAEVDTPSATFNTTDWRIIPTAGGTIHLNTTADQTTVAAALGALDRNRSFYVIEVGRTYSWDGANLFENASGQRKTLVANLADLANLPSGPHTNGEARPVTSERQDYIYFNDADASIPGFVAANNVVGGWLPSRLPLKFPHTGTGPFTAYEGLLNTYPPGEVMNLPAPPSSNTVLLATQEGETGPVQTYRSNDAGDGWINISQADGDDQAAAWEGDTLYDSGDVVSALEPDTGDADFGQPFNWYRIGDGTSGSAANGFDLTEKPFWIRMALDTDPANWVEQDSTTDAFPIVTYGGKTRIIGDGTASTVVNVPTPGGMNSDADFQVMNLATVQIQVNMGSANTRPIDGLVNDPDTLVELEPGERLRGYSLGSFDTRYEVIGTGAESAPVRHYTTANLAVSDEDQIAVFDEAGTYTLPAMSLDRRIAFAKTVAGAVTLTADGAEEFTSPAGTSTDQLLTINDILRFGTLVGKGDASSWSAFEGATTVTAPAVVATTISRHGASNPGNGNRFSHGTEVTNTGDIVYDGAGTYTIGTAGQYSVTYSLLTVQGSGTGNVTASLSVGGVPVGPTVGASNDTSNWAFNGSATITLTLNAGDTVELRQVSTPGFGGTNKVTLMTISGL